MQYVCTELFTPSELPPPGDPIVQTCSQWSEYQSAVPAITHEQADVMLGFFLKLMLIAFAVIICKRMLLN